MCVLQIRQSLRCTATFNQSLLSLKIQLAPRGSQLSTLEHSVYEEEVHAGVVSCGQTPPHTGGPCPRPFPLVQNWVCTTHD